MDARRGKRAMACPAPWLDGPGISHCSAMQGPTAQVTPLELTEAFVSAAVANGAQLRMGRVTGVDTAESADGLMRASAVHIEGERVVAKSVVIAMGPWSVEASSWFPDLKVPMEGIWSTSVVFESEVDVEGYALFCEEDTNGCHPEVYPRPDNSVYVCGCGGSRHVKAGEIR